MKIIAINLSELLKLLIDMYSLKRINRNIYFLSFFIKNIILNVLYNEKKHYTLIRKIIIIYLNHKTDII